MSADHTPVSPTSPPDRDLSGAVVSVLQRCRTPQNGGEQATGSDLDLFGTRDAVALSVVSEPSQPLRVAVSAPILAKGRSALSAAFGGVEWRAGPTGGKFGFRYLALGDSRVLLGRSLMTGSLRGIPEPGSTYIVVTLIAGAMILTDRHGSAPLHVGVPAQWGPGHDAIITGKDHNVRLVELQHAHVASVAAERGMPAARLHHLRPQLLASDPAAARWHEQIDTAGRALIEHGIGSEAWETAVRGVAEAFLDLCQPSAERLTVALNRTRNERLQTVLVYFHSQLNRKVSIAELTTVCRVSARSMQEGFRRHFGVSPLEYHRQIRLDHTRMDLLHADPHTITVATIARRRGFEHLGRFARYYATAFNELPSTTLRRSAPTDIRHCPGRR